MIIVKKSLLNQIMTGLVKAVITSLVAILTVGGTLTANANIVERNALQDCGTASSYNNLISYELIDPTVTTPDMVKENCKTIKARTESLLKEFGATKYIPVFITGELYSFCGEMTTGCVQNLYGINEEIPAIMSISYTADYYGGLRDTVAHEYVHTLTSSAELTKLNATPSIWVVDGEQVKPGEAAADCGRYVFTGGAQEAGAYMTTCTAEQTEISIAIINNTY